MIRRRDSGYTLVELGIAIVGAVSIVVFAAAVIAVCHFVAKWW